MNYTSETYSNISPAVFCGGVAVVDYYGADNDNYVDGAGFCCEPKTQQKNARSLPTENVDYEKLQYYYHSDHLGSASYITNLDGEVVQHIEYVPFGEVFLEERNNTWNTPYLFNGKELDEETGLYYYGARYYNPKTSQFLSTDRYAEKYPDASPYQYCLNNPVKFLEVNGDSLNVNQFQDYDSKASDDLISDLAAKSGLNLSVDKDGNVSYEKDMNTGRAVITRDENGKKIGSRAARKALKKVINSETTISVGGTDGLTKVTMDGTNPNLILFNPQQTLNGMSNTSIDLDKTTNGYALTFFHEIGHTAYGGAGQDPPFVPGQDSYTTAGRQERLPNRIRRQLGNSYGQRSSYTSHTIQGSPGQNYFPWSKSTLRQLQQGKVPTQKYIIQPWGQ